MIIWGQVNHQGNRMNLMYSFQEFFYVENLRLESFIRIFPNFIQVSTCKIDLLISILHPIHVDKWNDNKSKVFLKYIELSVIHEKLNHAFQNERWRCFSRMLSCQKNNTFRLICWCFKCRVLDNKWIAALRAAKVQCSLSFIRSEVLG